MGERREGEREGGRVGQVRPRSHSHLVSQEMGRFGQVSQYSCALSPPKDLGGAQNWASWWLRSHPTCKLLHVDFSPMIDHVWEICLDTNAVERTEM